jgi:type II secretory pathway component PulK
MAQQQGRLAGYETNEVKTTYLARAGVIKMLAEIMNDKNSYDSLNEAWNKDEKEPFSFNIGTDIIKYNATDECARLNLNSPLIKKEYLVGLGVDEELAENIISYRAGKSGGRFEFPEELFLVEGMSKDIYSAIEEYITVYRKDEKLVNINTASYVVLKAITGNPVTAEEIINYRKGPDNEEGTKDDGLFKSIEEIPVIIKGLDPSLFRIDSYIFRIYVAIYLNGQRAAKEVEAVADRTGKIISWKEL